MPVPPEPSERAPLIRLIGALSEEIGRLASDEELRPVFEAALAGARARLAVLMPPAGT